MEKTMKSADIRVADFTDKLAIHDFLAKELEFPSYYGKNLDALYDVLTEPCFGGNCLVLFIDCAGFSESMPRYYAAMQQMCKAAADVNPGLTVEFAD